MSILLACLLVIAFSACDETNSVNPNQNVERQAPVVSASNFPSFWVFGSDLVRQVSLSLNLPEETRIAIAASTIEEPKVFVRIVPPSGSENTDLRLYDDGGSQEITQSFDFLTTYSGDLVPGDFNYSLKLNSLFAQTEGCFDVIFYAGWFDTLAIEPQPEHYTTIVSDTFVVEINSPPIISNVNLPDSLFSGFSPEVWSVDVADPDVSGGDAIVEVTMNIELNGSFVREKVFTYQNSDQWTLSADSSFSTALATDNYQVSINAHDMFEQPAEAFTKTIWIENTVPVIFDLSVPDTVILPLEGANRYTFRLSATDKQGLGDIEKLYFTLRRPDGETRDNNGQGFSFGDDGQNPDEVAGDGHYVYDFPLARDPNNPPVLGTYTFYFFGLDRAGNTTEAIEAEIVEIAEDSE